MNTKRLTVTATGVMLTAFVLGAAAAPNTMDHPNKVGHEQRATHPHKEGQGSQSHDNKDRDDDDDEDRDNENSNRQSDPGSTRGLERAEERHSEKAGEHAQSGEESHWYDALLGRDKNKDKDMTKKEPRWWWPFS